MSNTTTQKTIIYPPKWDMVYAGTPINAAGEVSNGSDAIGVLQDDIRWPNQTGTVITAGIFDAETAASRSGLVLSADAVRAMSKIMFTDEDGRLMLKLYALESQAPPMPDPEEDVGKILQVGEDGKMFWSDVLEDIEDELSQI